MKQLRQWLWLVGMGLAVAAVVRELQKPPEDRTWHGKVFEAVPYDFRVPTLDRLREAYWNPDNQAIFTDRPLGVGWAINFYQLFRMLRGFAARPAE